MEAARFLKSKQPHSIVEVKDLKSGDVTAVALSGPKKNPAAGGASAGLSTGGSPRRAKSWTPNRASRPR